MKKLLIFLILAFLFKFNCLAINFNEKVQDSLASYNFKELDQKFHKFIHSDKTKSELITYYYLNRAKELNGKLHTSKEYYYVSRIHENNLKKRLVYLDSAIIVSKNLENKIFLFFKL